MRTSSAGTVPIYSGGCLDRLNPLAIIDGRTDGVMGELQRLESPPESYEAKRRASLLTSRLSLDTFEKQFEELVIRPFRERKRASISNQ
jgi:hypothetical protein